MIELISEVTDLVSFLNDNKNTLSDRKLLSRIYGTTNE